MAKKQSARQKMINLMYLVFIAMLALNVSIEVLQGFDLINENLQKAIANSSKRNNQLYGELSLAYNDNPAKTEDAYNKSLDIHKETANLFDHIQSLKLEIAQKTDGKEADVDNLKNREDINASTDVMIDPLGKGGKGDKLKELIDAYRKNIATKITDESMRDIIESSLSTNLPARASAGQTWSQVSFDRMPSVAVISYLTGLQVSVKTAEGEALSSLIKEIDISDYRVNNLDAYVIPQSDIVMAGVPYQARITLAAEDTTQRPTIVLDTKGGELKNGIYTMPTSRSGNYSISGYVEVKTRGGDVLRRPFEQKYSVSAPMATVAPLMMDVLYAGIDNPISISVPGVSSSAIQARASQGGSLTAKGENWVARPTQVGGKFTIDVIASVNGTTRKVAEKTFRIRALPDPVPYMDYTDANGNAKKFKRGRIARTTILSASQLKAEIDDGILNLPFSVISFRTVFIDAMGNAIPETSDGANFSQRQLDQIKRLGRGSYFFITGVKAIGPDRIEREIASIEVRLN